MASNEDSKKEIGSWSPGEMLETGTTAVHYNDDEMSSNIRFLHRAAKLIRKRAEINKTGNQRKKPAVFIFCPSPSFSNNKFPLKVVHMLDNGADSISGKIWFVSSSVGRGKCFDMSLEDHNEIIERLCEDCSLNSLPAITYDPRTSPPTAKFHPGGIKTEEYIEIDLFREKISTSEIFEAIGTIHKGCLVTPAAQSKAVKLWEDESKNRPKENAEALIQGQIKPGLIARFLTCVIKEEETGPSGRFDLGIVQPHPLDKTEDKKHAILELKVLRSCGSTGKSVSKPETEKWIAEGLTQVAAYQIDKGYELATLCCFDMRKVKEEKEKCFNHIVKKAKKLKVECEKWDIYSDTKEYQKVLTCS